MIRADQPPIVVFGDDWGRHVSTMQHLFRRVLPSRQVVWVNAIGHRTPSLGFADMRRAFSKGLAMFTPSRREVGASGRFDDLTPDAIVQPRVLPWHHRRIVHSLNTVSLVRAVRTALARLGIRRPPIIVTGSPPSVGVIGRLGEVASVYYCMDDFAHLPGVSAEMIGPLETRLLGSVDAVVATAKRLTELKIPRTGEVHYLPQGVNYEHFATKRELPSELEVLPRPRIGFAGGISAACDFELIAAVADANAAGSVVLVGPVNVDIHAHSRPNIHAIGNRPYEDLPAYVQGFDVGMIPYLRNEWTRSVDPLKLLEYLAAGIPVVTTPLPEIAKYSSAVSVAEDVSSFLEAIASALRPNAASQVEAGQKVASANTWESRAGQFLGILDNLVAAKPSV